MTAKYILAALSVVFLAFGVVRLAGGGGSAFHPQAKAWLLIAAIFGVVAAYLFLQ